MCLAGIFAKHHDKLPAVAIGKKILDSGETSESKAPAKKVDKKSPKKRKNMGLSINTQQSPGLAIGNQ